MISLFIEYEALRYQADPEADPAQIVRATLLDVAKDLEVPLPDDRLQKATEIVLRPPLQGDVLPVLSTLHAQGYSLACLCPTDNPILSSHIDSSLPSDIIQILDGGRSGLWYNMSTSLYSALLDRCRVFHPSIEPHAITIVTASPHRVVGPAHAAGFPTVLVYRLDDIESSVLNIVSPPTLIVGGLEALVSQINDLSIVQTEATEDERRLPSIFRLQFYETRECIGHKGLRSFRRSMSFSLTAICPDNVFAAINVLTSRPAAIKIDTGSYLVPGENSALSYEAAVHRLMEGHPGIPKLRWAGTENNSYAIIMDQLGPNIGHLRQFCRGTLTLRTVLTLARQMVRYHCLI